MIQRTIIHSIIDDLSSKMVFLSGPRQVGKTTLARSVLEQTSGTYMNWDDPEDRKSIIKSQWPVDGSIVVLDEIHKYRKWKNFVKGQFDKHREQFRFLVTGSARLDIYRKGSDSLQGRYHRYRLHPFSVAEIQGILRVPQPFSELKLASLKPEESEATQRLLKFGGFPEPYISADERTARRWHRERIERVLIQDIRDISTISDIGSIELLIDMLPDRVGSPFSINSVREDLEVSHRAVSHWMDVLEQLYVCYKIRPFFARATRSLKKEPKVYLWDWSHVDNQAARLENMVAGHLLKFCHHLQDIEGFDAALHYLRDREKREVDFLVTVDKKPWFAVEVKTSGGSTNNLRYFAEKLGHIQQFYVSPDIEKPFVEGDIIHTPLPSFLLALGV